MAQCCWWGGGGGGCWLSGEPQPSKRQLHPTRPRRICIHLTPPFPPFPCPPLPPPSASRETLAPPDAGPLLPCPARPPRWPREILAKRAHLPRGCALWASCRLPPSPPLPPLVRRLWHSPRFPPVYLPLVGGRAHLLPSPSCWPGIHPKAALMAPLMRGT